jgi:hypothetical protein
MVKLESGAARHGAIFVRTAGEWGEVVETVARAVAPVKAIKRKVGARNGARNGHRKNGDGA